MYLRAGHGDGYQGLIEQDSQSTLDKLFGTRVSHAPGPLNVMRNALDARVDLSLDHWRLRAAYQQREMGVGTGIADTRSVTVACSRKPSPPTSWHFLGSRYQACRPA